MSKYNIMYFKYCNLYSYLLTATYIKYCGVSWRIYLALGGLRYTVAKTVPALLHTCGTRSHRAYLIHLWTDTYGVSLKLPSCHYAKIS